ncbi:dienelactone hydrolase family protein [Sphingomicrobium sp. XHP0235]|uniref:dienelactone hydrolase family protein n=1 Tax=Sphingomicrobium aquimarinum TaxID=3133971 RepID=UPI0031FE7082
MCEKDSFLDTELLNLSRRRFAALGLATTLAACSNVGGRPGRSGLSERNVSITTPDGVMDAFFVAPSGVESQAVIVWPDIASLRPAFEVMARRTASTGRAVLVANPYYRDTKAPQFADFATFRERNGFELVGPWRDKLTPEALRSDTNALVDWLDAQAQVDSDIGIVTEGYCMGGPFTVRSAVARPDRVRAAASFHGGGLVTDAADSPHRQLDETQARFLFAIAQDDDAESPDAKRALRAAAQAAGRPAEIEVYAGDHGWTVLDSPAYAQAAAERAYGRKIALYDAVRSA